MTSCRFSRWRISAILDFRDPIMGSLKSPCTTSYRSSIETIALNCLVFEKIAFFAFWRQTDRQTNRRTTPMHEADLAIASGGSVKHRIERTMKCGDYSRPTPLYRPNLWRSRLTLYQFLNSLDKRWRHERLLQTFKTSKLFLKNDKLNNVESLSCITL